MPESHLPLPHQDSHVQTGFLTQIWEAKETLPRLQGVQVWLHYLQRGFETVTALPMSNTVAILTVALSLFLFGGFLSVVRNVEQILMSAGNNLYLTAYLKEGTTDEQGRALVKRISAESAVHSATFVSKNDALEAFRKDLGERRALLDGLESENPLPASIDVVLTAEGKYSPATQQLVDRLKADGAVGELVYGSEWFDRMQGVLKVFRLFGLVLSMLVLGIVLFLISNTIKLVIFSRRHEIEIMQLVGATDSLIKVPFLIGGAIQGLTGAVLGMLLLHACLAVFRASLHGGALFGVLLPDVIALSPVAIAAILLAGAVMGAAASLFALGRHMQV